MEQIHEKKNLSLNGISREKRNGIMLWPTIEISEKGYLVVFFKNFLKNAEPEI